MKFKFSWAVSFWDVACAVALVVAHPCEAIRTMVF